MQDWVDHIRDEYAKSRALYHEASGQTGKKKKEYQVSWVDTDGRKGTDGLTSPSCPTGQYDP